MAYRRGLQCPHFGLLFVVDEYVDDGWSGSMEHFSAVRARAAETWSERERV